MAAKCRGCLPSELLALTSEQQTNGVQVFQVGSTHQWRQANVHRSRSEQRNVVKIMHLFVQGWVEMRKSLSRNMRKPRHAE
jgi:hypothetical protein